jgi:hypothetical protein
LNLPPDTIDHAAPSGGAAVLGIYAIVFPMYFSRFYRLTQIETTPMKHHVTPRLIMAGTCDDMGHLP